MFFTQIKIDYAHLTACEHLLDAKVCVCVVNANGDADYHDRHIYYHLDLPFINCVTIQFMEGNLQNNMLW